MLQTSNFAGGFKARDTKQKMTHFQILEPPIISG